MKTGHLGLRNLVFLSLCCVLLAGLAGTSQAGLRIVGLDVGQGDCTLIISPTGKTVLIDAGYTGKGTGTVIPYLQSQGIHALDYTFASHYHVDHIGGMDEVINTLTRDSIRVACFDRGWSYTTQAYTQYATATGSKRQTLTEGQVIDLGGGATLKCVALNSHGHLAAPYDADRYDENNLSVVLLLDYGEFEMMLAGDLPGSNTGSYHDIESLVAAEVGDVDVYKVDHHGSSSASNTTLLSTILPEASLIYVGNGNSYGHPTQAVIDRLVSVNSYIYQTELGSGGTIPSGEGEVANGHITIDVTPGQYTINGDLYSLGSSGVEPVYEPGFVSIYPNPFSNEATLKFRIAQTGPVAIKIFDVRGRLVTVFPALTGGSVTTLTWDGQALDRHRVPAGVYFVRISGPSGSLSQKLVRK